MHEKQLVPVPVASPPVYHRVPVPVPVQDPGQARQIAQFFDEMSRILLQHPFKKCQVDTITYPGFVSLVVVGCL